MQYSKIAVLFLAEDLALRKYAEDSFARADPKYSDRFVAVYSLLFPGRTYSKEEMQEILATHGIQAVLLFTATNSGLATSTTPGQSETTCTYWSTTQGCFGTETRHYGSTTVYKPWGEFQLILIDGSTGTNVWVASAESGGNAFANHKDLLNSVSKRALKQLRDDGLIE
jgi:hypothetical protein